MLETELLPHTARDHAGSVVETLAQHVSAAANREKQVLMRQMVTDLLQSDAGRPCVVRSLKFDGKQVRKAVRQCLRDLHFSGGVLVVTF